MSQDFTSGKANLVDHIRSVKEEQTTGRYKRLNPYSKDYQELGFNFINKFPSEKYLLRSAYSVEGQEVGKSFAGLFSSEEVTQNTLLKVTEELLNPSNKKIIEQYAKARGVDLSLNVPEFILHQQYSGDVVHMLEHPNKPGFFQIEKLDPLRPEIAQGYLKNGHHTNKVGKYRAIIEDYLEITSTLDPTISYLMEVILEPKSKKYKLVQLTPAFQKKEYPKSLRNLGTHTSIGFPAEEEIHFGKLEICLDDGSDQILRAKNKDKVIYFGQGRVISKLTKGLPLEIFFKEKKIDILAISMGDFHYLDHVGLLNIENIDSVIVRKELDFNNQEFKYPKEGQEITYKNGKIIQT